MLRRSTTEFVAAITERQRRRQRERRKRKRREFWNRKEGPDQKELGGVQIGEDRPEERDRDRGLVSVEAKREK